MPFTTDLQLCRQLLDETAVRMAGPRTALWRRDRAGHQAVREERRTDENDLALTDGNDNSSAVPPAEAASVAKDRGITIHTIAVGDPTTVGEEKLDQEALQAVAQTTGGDFFLAMNREELAEVYERLDSIETREVEDGQPSPAAGPVLLAAGRRLACLAGGARWETVAGRAAVPQATLSARLRVNPRTFELETIEP